MNDNFVLNDVLWVDAELKKIEIDYSELIITMIESTGRHRKIFFKGYIGYSVVGFWDEVVIERFVIYHDHEFLEKCLLAIEDKYGKLTPQSGDELRNRKKYKLGEICLNDGTTILIVANSAEAS